MRFYLVLISVITIFASGAFAQGKIGYVDSQRIFAELPEFQEAEAKFEKEVKEWENQATVMKEQIDSILVEQEKNSLVWSTAKKNEIENLLVAKQDTLQQFLDITFGPNGKAEKRMTELSQPLRDKIVEIIRRISFEKDFDMVFDAAVVSIAYAKESLDLTDDVINEIKKTD